MRLDLRRAVHPESLLLEGELPGVYLEDGGHRLCLHVEPQHRDDHKSTNYFH
jgi:hypothetical protein